MAADNIFNPFDVPIGDLRRRLVELPPRIQQNTSEVTRLGVLLEGLFAEWSWEWALDWSESEARENLSGIINADHLRRGVGPAEDCQGAEVDGCVPIDLFGAPGSIDQARSCVTGLRQEETDGGAGFALLQSWRRARRLSGENALRRASA